ncbi:MAG TPA: AraC family transcriptional regulator [Steroidobacteraceae bacterium]|nr:AraC family transcriptional regulator [Steroidobacteraceae bacterium]
MMRMYLLERATESEWADSHIQELSRTIVTCLGDRPGNTNQDAPPSDAIPRSEVLRQAIRFVNENLDSKLRWDDIAAALGLDPFTFGRGFKLAAGITPHQYIIRCRLRQAMRLLARKDLSLAEIALEVGCSCQSHLTTLFRKHLGTTPGAFRQLAQRPRRGSLFAASLPREDRSVSRDLAGGSDYLVRNWAST